MAIQATNQVTERTKIAARATAVQIQKDWRPGIRVMALTANAAMSVTLVTVIERPA